MQYIVTGGAGFIGSVMLWQLNEMGIDDILVVDHLGSSDKWKNLVNRRFTDYMDRDSFLKRVQAHGIPLGVRGIIHLGACSATTEKDCDFLMQNNFHYSRILCEEALKRDIRFINASSASTYGDGRLGFDDGDYKTPFLKPLNMYGYSKQLFDLWLLRKKNEGNVASLKFFNVYGPNEYHKGNMSSVVYKGFMQIKDTNSMTLFKSNHSDYADGGQMRDFIYVKDCVKIMWWFLQNNTVKGIFNVGTGKARSWNDLAKALFVAMNIEENIEYINMPENLIGKYQNFTEAKMDKMELAGCPVKISPLELGVADYVQNYLQSADSFV